jgi:hypothetical protein
MLQMLTNFTAIYWVLNNWYMTDISKKQQWHTGSKNTIWRKKRRRNREGYIEMVGDGISSFYTFYVQNWWWEKWLKVVLADNCNVSNLWQSFSSNQQFSMKLTVIKIILSKTDFLNLSKWGSEIFVVIAVR